MPDDADLVTTKSLAKIDWDQIFDSINELTPGRMDGEMWECRRSRLVALTQDLRDLNIHARLGLELPSSLRARANTNYEIWKLETAEWSSPSVRIVSSLNAVTSETCTALVIVPRVPSTAETILSYVCTPDRLEAVLGDLERNFDRRAAKHGEKAARHWYWWQTARTVIIFGIQIIASLALLRGLFRKLGL
jgi:hypothetical protein